MEQIHIRREVFEAVNVAILEFKPAPHPAVHNGLSGLIEETGTVLINDLSQFGQTT